MDSKKPDMAILIGRALAKKGKSEPMPEGDDSEEGSSGDDQKEHLKEIAKDLLDAIESKDVDAMADLIGEAIECCSQGEMHEE